MGNQSTIVRFLFYFLLRTHIRASLRHTSNCSPHIRGCRQEKTRFPAEKYPQRLDSAKYNTSKSMFGNHSLKFHCAFFSYPSCYFCPTGFAHTPGRLNVAPPTCTLAHARYPPTLPAARMLCPAAGRPQVLTWRWSPERSASPQCYCTSPQPGRGRNAPPASNTWVISASTIRFCQSPAGLCLSFV
jgi:hypothetical protein